MAITSNCSKFLFYAETLGVSFDKSVSLGRMYLYAGKEDIRKQMELFKSKKSINDVIFKDVYSEPLFTLLGASQADSMDYSDYENATIIHDLNKSIPDSLKNKYTVVFDGGTIEHVFNFPVAIKNCMEMLKTGGHYIGITPVNNTMGHGFYQFSPEVFFNIFSTENGFKVIKAVVVTDNMDHTYSEWYEVMNPSEVKSRVMLVNSKPTYLMIIAEKERETEIFASTPQQSDYQTFWAIHKALQSNKIPENEGRMKYLYRKFMPRPLKIFLKNTYEMFTKEKIKDENLGNINPDHFKKIKLS